MIQTLFKISWRNLWKNKSFTLINIVGLAIGMAVCLLIYTYIQFELSYDKFHSKADRIYRLSADLKLPKETLRESYSPSAISHQLMQDEPEVENVVRLMPFSLLVQHKTDKYQETRTFFTDSTLFSIFDLPLVKGDANTALKEPFTVVLSQSTAKKYFGNENPIGQTLHIMQDAMPMKVTGVMADMPLASSFQADLFVSLNTIERIFKYQLNDMWANFSSVSFLLLKRGVDANQFASKLPGFLERRFPKELKENNNMSLALHLEPLTDIYLNADRIAHDNFLTGNRKNNHVFSSIVFFIILIAAINFINLSTAKAVERAKEVGVRKVVGAHRIQLVAQFLVEGLIVSLMACFLGILLAQVLLPAFNTLAGKSISHTVVDYPGHLLLLFAAALAVGLLAGLYPAFVLSGFKPIAVLKGRYVSSSGGVRFRKALVVAQFTIAIALITITLVVYHQLHFMRSKSLGFDKEQTLVIETRFDTKQEAFKTALSDIPAVKGATLSGSVPGSANNLLYTELENSNGDMQAGTIDQYIIDYEFIPQYGMNMQAGRNFSRNFGDDTTTRMLINEAAVRTLGYTNAADVIGKKFKFNPNGNNGQIIGVVSDFNFQSLHQVVKPLTLMLGKGNFSNYISIKLQGNDLPATMKAIEARWNQTIPNRPFNYFFADEYFDRQYKAEVQFGKLFLNFTVLAIFISCLGLLALTAYSALQRQKEIGIRKVLGASAGLIVRLLSFDFLKPIVIALFIAIPMVWLSMDHWLSNFAYHIDMAWWMFAAGGMLAILVAFITVVFHAIRAARVKPVVSLRDE
ncbi:ABC transporter permease [Olivibacter ginsenosidimutans]|uniref:ABC transporter permease n=1 Tax=Olivibacter ginsenosidimutans TaxID=1176537 RepID=A0ABP9BU81_9SPHI